MNVVFYVTGYFAQCTFTLKCLICLMCIGCMLFKSLRFNVAADVGVFDDNSDIWSSLLQDDSYDGSQNSPTSLVAGTTQFMPMFDQDDVFSSPLSSTSSCDSSCISVPSATITQCQQEIPIPPDISPLLRGSRTSTDEQMVARVPTPPDITPLLKGALSSANIQLPLASAQPSPVSVLRITQAITTFD